MLLIIPKTEQTVAADTVCQEYFRTFDGKKFLALPEK